MKIISNLSAYLLRLRPIDELIVVIFTTAIVALPTYWLSSPASRGFNLFYMLPIVIPFGLFLFDRHRHFFKRPISILIDTLIIGASLARVFFSVPFVSGHSLFLSYSTLTTSRPMPRVISGIGLWYTAFDKLSNFGDFWTLFGGIVLGILAALLFCLTSNEAEQGAAANP